MNPADDDLSPIDIDALERCLRELAADPEWLQQRRRAGREDWFETAICACRILQQRSMRLMPWEICPCASNEHELDHLHLHYAERKAVARRFADELRRAGLSIYEPDPQRALAAASVSKIPNKNLAPDAA